MEMLKKPTMLMILDGYGLNENEKEANAIRNAKKPNLDKIFEKYPLQAYWAIIGLIVASPVAIVLVNDFSGINLISILTGAVMLVIGIVVSIAMFLMQVFRKERVVNHIVNKSIDFFASFFKPFNFFRLKTKPFI